MILYIENPKDSTKKTTITDKFSKVAGYKISVAFLYTNTEDTEREIKKTIPFTVAPKIKEKKKKKIPRNELNERGERTVI